jgi:drug/metabolite transporter (DMT)-like permease
MLIATAALHLTASMSAIINSMAPLFTALVVWGWMKEKLTIKKWIGIFVGISGVVVLVGWSPIQFTTEVFVAVVLSILSTVFYGFGGVYAKKTFAGVSPLSLAFGQQLGASILLFPITLFNLPNTSAPFSSAVIFSVLGLALFCTAIGYILYYYLLASVGPTKTISVTFLVPPFGMIWGILLLQEQITIGLIMGLAVILSSIFLISDIQLRRRVK